MRPTHPTLDRAQVHQLALPQWQDHIPLKSTSRKLTPHRLWQLLIAAAVRLSSLSATCRGFTNAPGEETARKAIIASMPSDLRDLVARINSALRNPLPPSIRRRPAIIACDFTLIPDHGQPFADPQEILRSKPQSGTSHFHGDATAFLVHRGQRFTLAAIPVLKGAALDAVLRRLLAWVVRSGVKLRIVLLDREFCTVAVFRALQADGRAFLTPRVCRGRAVDDPRGPSGSKVFQAAARSGWSPYTLTDARGRAGTVDIVVKCPNRNGRRGRHGRERLVSAAWGLGRPGVDWVRSTDRKRFGIERSSRQMHQCRIRTSTRRPDLRPLSVAVALVIRNLWARLHWEGIATPRRGGRDLHPQRLRLLTLRVWWLHAIEEALGSCDEIAVARPCDMDTYRWRWLRTPSGKY